MTISYRTISACMFALGCASLVAFAKRESAPAPLRARSEKRVTFNRDLAPIFFHYCAPCHHPDEAGPFPLLTYADAKSHARQIAALTAKRFMPPWLPEPQKLKFADELRLSDEQIALIQKWVDQGEDEGAPADLPPTPQFVPGWQIGRPTKSSKPKNHTFFQQAARTCIGTSFFEHLLTAPAG